MRSQIISFDPGHVTLSPPIAKRIWVGRYNNTFYPWSQNFETLQIRQISNKSTRFWITDLYYDGSLLVGHYLFQTKAMNSPGGPHIKRTGMLVVPLRGEKEVLVLLRVSLKRSTEGAFPIPFRVLSRKKKTTDKLLVFGHRSLIKNIAETAVINILKTCILWT